MMGFERKIIRKIFGPTRTDDEQMMATGGLKLIKK